MKYWLTFVAALAIGIPVGAGLQLTSLGQGILCGGISFAILIASNEYD